VLLLIGSGGKTQHVTANLQPLYAPKAPAQGLSEPAAAAAALLRMCLIPWQLHKLYRSLLMLSLLLLLLHCCAGVQSQAVCSQVLSAEAADQ
jgi:hypothetical protein